jgi:ketosteroid isomerase-like protein
MEAFTMYKVFAPQDMNKTFAQARNVGDVEGLLSLFEPEAVIQEAERRCAGAGELRAHLEWLVALGGEMASENNFAVVAGELALLRADYAIYQDGKTMVTGSSAEVVRRQPDGRWLYVIDYPVASLRPNGLRLIAPAEPR